MGLNLIKNYNKLKHQEIFGLNKLHINYMYTKKWDNEENIPYVLKTHLLDSYYCLPERPDMAFTFLWKCMNNIYSTYQRKNSTDDTRNSISDSALLEFISKGIFLKLNDKLMYSDKEYTLKDIIKSYINDIPQKVLNFVSNYILKSYVIDQKLTDKRYISSSYNTFRTRFPIIHEALLKTYGNSFLDICNPKIVNYEVVFDIKEENLQKSKDIKRSLSESLKKLLLGNEIELTNKNNTKYNVKIDNDEEFIKFIIFNILYAIRNNTLHGKIASRLNSKTANGKSFRASKYIYLLGYMFLSIMLYVSNELELNDLSFNFENIKYLK